MVDFGIRDNTTRGMKRAFELGEEAAKMVTDHFQQFSEAIVLENEKVCWPYMIWKKKKRYCSRYYEDPDGKGKIDVKGLELTRRDNCNLLKTLFKKVLDTIMPLEGNALDLNDLESAIAKILDDCLQNIMLDKIPIAECIISKSLRKDYKNTNLPHVYLSKQLTHRILHEGLMGYDVPKSGDRIPYVIVQKKKGMKLYECAEHPKYVQENALKIDRIYYVRQQLQKPIVNLTSYCLPYANDMFEQCIKHLERIQSGNRSLATMFGKTASTSLAIHKAKTDMKPSKKRAVQQLLSNKRPKTKPPLKKLKMVPKRSSKQTKLKLCRNK
jgi:DNA polymerase delta subunit 1